MPSGSKPGERRGGRKKGTPNKLTIEVKTLVLQALDEAGGVVYLKNQAEENPSAFLTLVGKVIPLQANVDHGVSKGLGDILVEMLKSRS